MKMARNLAIIIRDCRMLDLLLELRSGVELSASNLQTALRLAIDAGAKFIMNVSDRTSRYVRSNLDWV